MIAFNYTSYMEINCPSCGVKHRTEDSPGAFEINCVCGYALLVPDEDALRRATPNAESVRIPISLEEEDQSLLIKPDVENTAPPAEGLTDSADLPDGMIYDPFEVQGFENPPPTLSVVENPPDEFSPDEPEPSAGRFDSVTVITTPEKPAPAQTIVNRSQAASMGQFLGATYDIECQGLDRESLVSLSQRCQLLVKSRPWLETELRRRQIRLETLADDPRLVGVPELIAIEIYLGCFELGGSCISAKTG